jgi:hypothetical protein
MHQPPPDKTPLKSRYDFELERFNCRLDAAIAAIEYIVHDRSMNALGHDTLGAVMKQADMIIDACLVMSPHLERFHNNLDPIETRS